MDSTLQVIEGIKQNLAPIIKGECRCDIFSRVAFASDSSIYQIMPAAVVAPRDAEDIVTVVNYAREHGIPIAARGGGSGLAGEALTSGIVFDMTRYMNRILSIAADGSTITCQPGAVIDDVNAALAKYGMKIGPDPSSANRATVAGCVANNATGSHSLQYGYISNYVERIAAVLADGSVIEFANNVDPAKAGAGRISELARRCFDLLDPAAEIIKKAMPNTKRNRCGYTITGVCHDGKIDIAKLLSGSEGTLAVFTEITLRAVPLPKTKAILQFEFASLDLMAQAVPIIVESGAAACELMDQTLARMAVDAYPQYREVLPTDVPAALVVEHVADDAASLVAKIEKTVAAVGALAVKHTIYTDAQAQARIWKARKDAVPLLGREKTDKKPIPFIEDVSVENRRLADYVKGLGAIAAKLNMPMAYYGHAGDGLIHVRPYLDLTKPADLAVMVQIAEEVFSLAWQLGGTISGEHADGLVRAAFIRRQYGDEFYSLLTSVKKIFDPANLLNPGKILNDDPDIMTKNLRAAVRYDARRLTTNLNFRPDEFRLEIEQCNGDGLCRVTGAGSRMCPVFRARGDEFSCSRAKANLIRAWATGLISEAEFESDDFKRILDSCVNCKMCSVQCPSGVDISKLIIEARTEYGKRKGFGIAVRVLARNRFLSTAGAAFGPFANFVTGLGVTKWVLEKLAGLDRRRQMPQFGGGQFISKARKYLKIVPPIAGTIDKVAYFTDCYVNFNDHELGFAVIKTLRHNGVEVIVPRQVPAPLPAVVYGEAGRARADLAYSVRYLAEAVRKGYKIVCSEPSAALCLKHELRFFMDSEDARLVSANTYELTAYLAGLLDAGKLRQCAVPEKEAFAYHAPCHLCALGAAGTSAKVLGKLCGATITDINSGCCGMAGTFGMQKKNYALSTEIGQEMAAAIGASKAQTVLTECSACKMQIEHLTQKRTLHPITVLARGYELI